MTTRSEARRIRRGRQVSDQQGQGHGERTYFPVTAYRRSGPMNWMAFAPEARAARAKQLAERDAATNERLRGYAAARARREAST